MASYTVVRSEPRLTAGGWQATVEAGQVLTVGEPASFNQDVADYLVEHGALVSCADPVSKIPVEPPLPEPETVEEPAPEVTP